MNTHRCCEVAASDSGPEPFAAPVTDREQHSPTFAGRCLASPDGWYRAPSWRSCLSVPLVWQHMWRLGPDSVFRSQPQRTCGRCC